MPKKLKLEQILWLLYAIVVGLALYIWGASLDWDLSSLNSYNIFPLFGLLAFSLMWVHYVSGVIRDYFFPGQSTKKSFVITSYAVLALILLHPGTLLFQLWRDGLGLPPASYKAYVSASSVIYVYLGTIALAGFLLFELKRFFGRKNWWKYVDAINDGAVILIMIHSLKLGQHLQNGWFKYVWYFYITTIGLCLVRKYYQKLINQNSK